MQYTFSEHIFNDLLDLETFKIAELIFNVVFTSLVTDEQVENIMPVVSLNSRRHAKNY